MSIIQSAKELSELIRKYNDQDLYEKIVSLRGEILELREECLALRKENVKLTKNNDIQVRLRRPDGANYYVLHNDVLRGNKYCLFCWDYDDKLVSLMFGNTGFGPGTKCNICDSRRT